MMNTASKIETIIEMTMEINMEIADKEAYIKEIEQKLTILNTWKEVNAYIGAELELKNVIKTIMDVVVGVLGASVCSIGLIRDNIWEITEYSTMGRSSDFIDSRAAETVSNELQKNGVIIMNDLKSSGYLGLKEGSFIALSLLRGRTGYGIITLFYENPEALNEGKIEFFKLIGAQLAIHLENAYLFEKVKHASSLDGLTGLYNRLHLNDILYKSGAVDIKDTAVIILDIDDFKKVNDTYGHIFGDSVIRNLSTILKGIQKKYPVTAFRYGGEEFLILCSGLELQFLHQIAEEIRLSFHRIGYTLDDGSTACFSVSLGVAKFGHSTKIADINHLIDIADEALYFSKKTGKNRYTLSDSALQLYIKAKDEINRALEKCGRPGKPYAFFCVKCNIDTPLSKVEYECLICAIEDIFRGYDSLFAGSTGEFIIKMENDVDLEFIKGRIWNVMTMHHCRSLDIHRMRLDHEIKDLQQLYDLLVEPRMCVYSYDAL